MDWSQLATIMGVVIPIITLMYAFLRNFKKDIDARFDRMERKFEVSDRRFEEMEKRVMETNRRMDGVYNILLKRVEGEKSS